MKKLFLLASVALVLVSCSKDDSGSNNNPQNPGQSQQGGGQPEQSTTPTPVPVGFVKTIKEYQREVSDSSLLKTTTYTVENNVLKGWEVLIKATGKKQTHILTYEGANLKTYRSEDGTNGVTEIYTFSYVNNKLDKVTRHREGDERTIDTYQITLDPQGRITKKTHVGNEGWDGQAWEVTFTYTATGVEIQKAGEPKYTITYTGENATRVVQEPSLGVPTNFEYDTTVVNDLNNKYIYLVNIAKLFNRWGIEGYQFATIDSPFVLNSKNVAKNDGTNTYEIEKNDQNKPTKITQKQAGIALQIKVYSY
jgi:hypothetical protein